MTPTSRSTILMFSLLALGAAAAAADAVDADASTSTTAATDDPAPAPRYPRAVIARPLTLPSGIAMLGGDATGNHDLSTMGGTPIVGYGITDKLEVQVPYGFTARELEMRGPLDVDVGYAILRGALGGKLEVIARVRGGYDLLATAARPLLGGLHAQYNVTDRFAVISGAPGTQQLRISLADDADGARPVDLGLPLGLGVQATGILYVQLDTKLAQVAISDSETRLFGRDVVPATVTVVCNVLPALDVQAAVGTDLMNAPGDNVSFLVGARYYAGE